MSARITFDGDRVLKTNPADDPEAAYEADALALWDGNGAVRLLDRDDARHLLVVERCRPGTPLDLDAEEAPAIVTALLTRLAVRLPESHPFPHLADDARRWANDVGELPVDARLRDAAAAVLRSAASDADHLVNQDLHGDNVLRAAREPWLVIDPKPAAGELEANGVGLLRNAAASGPAAVRRWLDALAGIGFDRTRTWEWGFAHALAWRNLEAAQTIFTASD